MKKIIAILLAGGKLSNEYKCFFKTPNNNFIIQEILNIIDKVNYQDYRLILESIYILFPPDIDENDFKSKLSLPDRNVIFVRGGEKLVDTVSNFVNLRKETIEENRYLLFIATDTPLIDFESLDDILKRFSLLDGDVFFPFVSKEVYKVQFGGNLVKRRTFVKLKKDSFCGTGILVIKENIFLSIWDKVKGILENRKDPIKIAKDLNVDFFTILKLISGNMTVIELERKLSEIFNIKAHGLLTNFANLAFNIDSMQDLKDYEEIVKNRLLRVVNSE